MLKAGGLKCERIPIHGGGEFNQMLLGGNADFGFGLQYDDFASGQRERATDGESDDACADYDAIQLICHYWILL